MTRRGGGGGGGSSRRVGGGGVGKFWSLGRSPEGDKSTLSLRLWSNPRPQKLLGPTTHAPTPLIQPPAPPQTNQPLSGCQTDKTGRAFLPASSSHCHQGETQVGCSLPSRNPFSPQQHWHQPRALHPSIHPSISSLKNPPVFSLSGGAGWPISDIHSAHMLTSDSFVKYQCICCPGDVPKTSCTIHTDHSLCLFACLLSFFVCFRLFLLCLCVL